MRTPPKLPTTDQCSAAAEVEAPDGEHAFAAWFPQQGGYGGAAVVTFERSSGSEGTGCFSVDHWHDGEFPRNEDPPDHRHYCSAEQIVDFGVLVLEELRKHQKQEDGSPVAVEPEWIAATIARLQALAAVPVPAPVVLPEGASS